VDEVVGLSLDRLEHGRVAVAGRVDGDAGGEVEEEVAVDVLDRRALAPDRHDRIGAREARRRPGLVERDRGARLRTGDLGHEVRNGAAVGGARLDGRHGRPPAARAAAMLRRWSGDEYRLCRLDIEYTGARPAIVRGERPAGQGRTARERGAPGRDLLPFVPP